MKRVHGIENIYKTREGEKYLRKDEPHSKEVRGINTV